MPTQHLLRPILKMPSDHPAVADPNCSCSGSPLQPGDPIPVTADSLFNPSGECAEDSGANLFYGYHCPYLYSANTGYYAQETATGARRHKRCRDADAAVRQRGLHRAPLTSRRRHEPLTVLP